MADKIINDFTATSSLADTNISEWEVSGNSRKATLAVVRESATGDAVKTQAKSSDIASAGTTDLATATGGFAHITGTTTITAFGTLTAGIQRHLTFDGALTLTHNATSLILPGAADIITAAGDIALMVSEGSGNWRCEAYSRASGLPVVNGPGGIFELVSPTTSDFSITTKTSGLTDSTTTSDDGYLLLKATKGSDFGNDEGIARLQTLGGSTFTYVMGFLPPPTYSTYLTCGLMVRDAAASKAIIFGAFASNNTALRPGYTKPSVVDGSGATWTHNADGTLNYQPGNSGIWFIKVVADGTNITGYISTDRVNWAQIFTETLATHVASPSHIGPAVFFRLAGTTTLNTSLRRALAMQVVHFGTS